MNYTLKPSLIQTSKVNNFDISPKNKKLLFDFSLLAKHLLDTKVITEIKQQCYNNCTSVINDFIAVFSPSSVNASFEYYSGGLYFKPYTVYSQSTGKRKYIIMTLVKIDHLGFYERDSIYDEYETIKEVNDYIGYDYQIEDLFVD